MALVPARAREPAGRTYGDEEMAFLRSVAACAATPIENGLMYAEVRDVNQKLSRKVFELKNLFDLSRELTSSFDAEAIRSLFVATVMGHLVVSRAALYLGGAVAPAPRPRAGRARGARLAFGEAEARAALSALHGAACGSGSARGPRARPAGRVAPVLRLSR